MIHQKVNYGQAKDCTVLEFGKGRIAVCSGYNEDHTAVMFKSVNEEHEIGSVSEKNMFSSDDFMPEIIMTFTKPESIDVVIEDLLKAKESLINLLKNR